YEAMRKVLYDRALVRPLPLRTADEEIMPQTYDVSPNGAWAIVYDNDDSAHEPYHDNYRQQLIWWSLQPRLSLPTYLKVDLPWGEGPSLTVADNGVAVLLLKPCKLLFVDLKQAHARDPAVVGSDTCFDVAISPSGAEVAIATARGTRRFSTTDPL